SVWQQLVQLRLTCQYSPFSRHTFVMDLAVLVWLEIGGTDDRGVLESRRTIFAIRQAIAPRTNRIPLLRTVSGIDDDAGCRPRPERTLARLHKITALVLATAEHRYEAAGYSWR